VANGSVDPCPAESEAQRYELPDGARFAELQGYLPGPSYTFLADLNGDGWLDLARGYDSRWDGGGNPGTPAAAWLFSPGSTSDSFWVPNDGYAPPVLVGPLPPINGYLFRSRGGLSHRRQRRRGDRLDSDPLVCDPDLPLPEAIARSAARDEHGPWGTIQITYDTGPRQRDLGLEGDAASHAIDVGEPLAPRRGKLVARTRGRERDGGSARIARLRRPISLCGPALGPQPPHRTRLARRRGHARRQFGGVVVLHAAARPRGALSERTTYDSSGHPLQHHTEQWELPDPAQVEGGWVNPAIPERRSHIGRLASRSTRNEYGDTVGESIGAVQQETFEYDDRYGYNFLTHVRTTRPSGGSERYLTPFGKPTCRDGSSTSCGRTS